LFEISKKRLRSGSSGALRSVVEAWRKRCETFYEMPLMNKTSRLEAWGSLALFPMSRGTASNYGRLNLAVVSRLRRGGSIEHRPAYKWNGWHTTVPLLNPATTMVELRKNGPDSHSAEPGLFLSLLPSSDSREPKGSMRTFQNAV
jgi:hypothetical protein